MKQSTVIIGIVVLVAIMGVVFYSMNMQKTEPKNVATEESQADAVADQDVMSNKTIVQTAIDAGNFKTLVAAVEAAGLVETLSGTGPYTVFAPSDEAFAKLPAGTVESLLKDKEKLAAILTYHVVPGKVMAADVVKMSTATTVQGQNVSIKAENGGVMINDAKVLSTDIEASNGVIHVIDTVLMPE